MYRSELEFAWNCFLRITAVVLAYGIGFVVMIFQELSYCFIWLYEVMSHSLTIENQNHIFQIALHNISVVFLLAFYVESKLCNYLPNSIHSFFVVAKCSFIHSFIPLFSIYSFTGMALECRKSHDTIL